jgi:hypothetical protein
MLSLIILPAWLAAFLIFRRIFSDWREAALAACIAWGVLVTVLSEILSLFNALEFVPLLVSWGMISCLSLGLSVHLWQKDSSIVVPLLQRKRSVPAILAAGIGYILLATFVVAVVSPPNNWDSMTYHMAKVANWIDHGSIRHYQTDILRQIWLGPWAEFPITHLQILSGGDRFAPCVQYVAMLGSLVGVSLVAKKFGADSRGQLFSLVFCLTIPMGILQASSTQNDYVASFWLLCFLNFMIDAVEASLPIAWGYATLMGASLGLAVLTKITTLVFATPFLIWITICLVRKRGIRLIPILGLLAVVAISINISHFIRNYEVFAYPLGPRSDTQGLKSEIHTPAALASNVIRNVALHLGTPIGLAATKAAILHIHKLTGLDINDERTSFHDLSFDFGPSLHEDYAGNPVHLLIIVVTIFIMLSSRPQFRLALIYSMCLAIGFLLFCGYLKWQPFNSRLHLPLFVAMAPVCGTVFPGSFLRKIVPALTIIILCIGALYATRNPSRPLLSRHASILIRPRTDLYFTNRPPFRDAYENASRAVTRGAPTRIGIITGLDSWEYPMRVLVQMKSSVKVRFEHVDVQNESRICPPDALPAQGLPEKIIVIGPVDRDLPPGYHVTFLQEPVRVLEKDAPTP